jgi:H+-transporting ATPase
MILIIALLNDGTIMTLSVDRVLPSNTPDSWDLAEIFSYAVAYGLYLTVSTIAFVIVILKTDFFENKFGVHLENAPGVAKSANDYQLHMIIYLQVAIISQALIFVTRSHGFFFMEMPSYALLGAFCIAQLISSIIAAYGNWGFTQIHAISGGWIGIVWVWNIIWFLPLDGIKFAMKATVIKYLRQRHERQVTAEVKGQSQGVPIARTTSRIGSIHESLYASRVGFIRRAVRNVGIGFKGGKKVQMSQTELKRFASISAAHTGQTLARHASRPN